MLSIICLLLSIRPITTTKQTWASVLQEPASTSAQMQVVQAAITLLLDEDEASTDNGFRSNPNGYSFQNYGGTNTTDFTVDDLRPIFGDGAVCAVKLLGRCLYNSAAVQWRNRWNQAMAGGHCYGMAVTSSRFFAGNDQPATFQANASRTFDLQLATSRRNIASYFVRQGANPVASTLQASLRQTPNQVLQQIRNSFDSRSSSLTIAIFGSGGGHAVTPYSVVEQGNGLVWIMVYDNNHPNDANRHIDFNTTNNTWSYNLGFGTWSGNGNTHSIGVIPYYLNNAIMQCPWCRASVQSSSASDSTQVWAVGDAKMLVTNDAGQRYGYVGDTFVEQIPDASTTVLMTGLSIAGPAIYNIPVSGTHTLLLNSGVITKPTDMTISQFGPDYAVTVEGITLNPSKQDQLQIAENGQLVAYLASEQKAISMTIALANLPTIDAAGQLNTSANQSYAFEVSNVNVGANQVVVAGVDNGDGTLTLNNSQNVGGSYSLEIERTDDFGQRTFVANTIGIGAGDTHIIDYATWGNVITGSAPVVIQVDKGSNGSVDSTVNVQNQTGKVYLPLVTR